MRSLVLVLLMTSIAAQSQPKLKDSMDAIFNSYFKGDEPGGAVLLLKDAPFRPHPPGTGKIVNLSNAQNTDWSTMFSFTIIYCFSACRLANIFPFTRKSGV